MNDESEIARLRLAEPPDRARAFVEAVLGARVRGFVPMAGGTATATHRVELEGRPDRPVLKRFIRADWIAREPDIVAREAAALVHVEALALPTPRLVAVDPDGSGLDCPGLLMSELPGRVWLPPRPGADWLDAIVRALPLIAACPLPDAGRLPAYQSFYDRDTLRPPEWSQAPDAWQRAIDRVREGPPRFRPVLLHRDYHPANVLFEDEQLSGIVDWTLACIGPAEVDLGHCRWNLAQLYGLELADRLRALWIEALGREPDPFWDVETALSGSHRGEVYAGWTELGGHPPDRQTLRARIDAYYESITARTR